MSEGSSGIENFYGRMWREGGVVRCKYVEGLVVDMNTTKAIVEDRAKVFNGSRYPILIDARGAMYWTKEAREYMGTKEYNSLYKAIAVVLNSHTIKILVNFWLLLSHPTIPVKIFTDEEEGLKWIGRHAE